MAKKTRAEFDAEKELASIKKAVEKNKKDTEALVKASKRASLSEDDLQTLDTAARKSQKEWEHFKKTGEASEEVSYFIEMSKRLSKAKK